MIFHLLEMEKDKRPPVIFGRSFGGASIEVRSGQMTFTVGNKTVGFDVPKRAPNPKAMCNWVQVLYYPDDDDMFGPLGSMGSKTIVSRIPVGPWPPWMTL